MKICVHGIRSVHAAVGIVVLLCALARVHAVEPPDMAVSICNDRVSDAILDGDYHRAEQVAIEFMERNPEQPAGPLFVASVRQYRAIDYDDFPPEEEFLSLIDEIVRRAEARLRLNGDDLWAQYSVAAAHGLQGSYASLTGSLLTGILKGRTGAAAMDRIAGVDSTFHDAYLFLGSYHYWKSDAAAWLPFIGDEKARGIHEVRQAIGNGYLTGPLANTVLLEILLDHAPGEARALADSLVAVYPRCRLFWWQLGEAYKKLERFDEAERVFTRIAAAFENDPYDDGSGPLRCWWKLAVLAADTGRAEKCVTYSKRVIAAGRHPVVAERQHDRIEGARDYFREFAHED